MDINDLEKLVAILEDSEVSEFEYEKDGTSIRIARALAPVIAPQQYTAPVISQQPVSGPAAPVAAPPVDPDESFLRVESPIVGTFYRKPSPDADNFVEVGSRVKKGQTLCIVEAMKLMNEIESPASGVIERILLEDSNVVEYGEVLFLIRPE